MSKADNKPEEEPIGPDDPLSATGMFLGSFQLQAAPSQAQELGSAKGDPFPPKQAPPFSPAPEHSTFSRKSASEAEAEGRGEFTQLFGTVNPTRSSLGASSSPASAVSRETPSLIPGEVTRIFASPPAHPTERSAAGPLSAAPANAPRMKGFSSPGASDSASAEGSFTQLFRTAPPVAARSPLSTQPSGSPPEEEKREWPLTYDPSASIKQPGVAKESPGVTELFRALSATDAPQSVQNDELPLSFSNTRPAVAPAPASMATPGDSFTVLIQRLTENTPPTPVLETRQLPPAAAAPSGLGEYTRIIGRDEIKASSVAPVQQVAAEARVKAPVTEPVKGADKPTPAAVSPAKNKLQELVPILLVLNAFLLVVVIVLVIFLLVRR